MTIKVCTIGNDEHTATIEHNWNNSSNEDGNPWSIRIEGMTATSYNDQWQFTVNETTKANANGYCKSYTPAAGKCPEGMYQTCKKSTPTKCRCSKPPTTCDNWIWDSDWNMDPVEGIPPVFDKYEKGEFYSGDTKVGTYTTGEMIEMSMA